ncbi:MAG: hypothetical protein J1E85_07990 [Ruminococcus sp.]|nr:hypothetical protein [Ruminococcus sp.]
MKKITSIMIALVLVAVASVSVFAAGINSNEQAVIDFLKGTITMRDGEMAIPTEFINSMENYFNTIDMTAEESTEIIAILKESETFVTNTGAANIADMTVAQKQELLSYGQKVVAVINMTMSYDKATKTLYIYDPDGNVVFAAVPTYVPVNGNSSNSNNSGNSSNSGVIKTTGADVNATGVATVAGIAVLLVAGCAFYFVKVKKEA